MKVPTRSRQKVPTAISTALVPAPHERLYKDVATELFQWVVDTYGKPETACAKYVQLKEYSSVVELDLRQAGFAGAVGFVDGAHARTVVLWLEAPDGSPQGYVDAFDQEPFLQITVGFVRSTAFLTCCDVGCFIKMDNRAHEAGGAFRNVMKVVEPLLCVANAAAEKFGTALVKHASLPEMAEEFLRQRERQRRTSGSGQ